jgi:predicted lipid-binding transport protein (Tim44 family)
MNRWILGFAVALLGLVMALPEAEARRLGGGRTMGAQRSITNAPPPAAPVRQAQQAAPASQPAAAPAAGGLSRWAPVLGGLAIGGLLGAMFGASGIVGMLLSWLAIALVAFGVVQLVRKLAQRRVPGGVRPIPYAAGGGPLAYQSLGQETVAAPPPSQASGFDGRLTGRNPLPPGFDGAAFLRSAKLNFMKLQAANDSGALDELREFTTPELFEELSKDLMLRGGSRQQTDVVSLDADLLEVVTEGECHWASVRFSGQIRESAGVAPEEFEEVWNLAKPVDGSSGWLLAGIQQMH